MMPSKIISGGQTGVDQAALITARKLGIETGGTAPHGWRTYAGPAPWLADYGLVEHASAEYAPRTRQNVEDSVGTLIFGDVNSPGCRLTRDTAVAMGRSIILIGWPPDAVPAMACRLRRWLRAYVRGGVLNVAGNREEMNAGVGAAVEALLLVALAPEDP